MILRGQKRHCTRTISIPLLIEGAEARTKEILFQGQDGRQGGQK